MTAFDQFILGLGGVAFLLLCGLVLFFAFAGVIWLFGDPPKSNTPDLYDPEALIDALESVDGKLAQYLASKDELSDMLTDLQMLLDAPAGTDTTDLLKQRLTETELWLDNQTNAHCYLEESVMKVEDRVKSLEDIRSRVWQALAVVLQPTLCENCDDAGFGECLSPEACPLKSEPVRITKLEDWPPETVYGCGAATEPPPVQCLADCPVHNPEWSAYCQQEYAKAEDAEGKESKAHPQPKVQNEVQ